MDHEEKAVEVYLEEYRALRKEVEQNLAAEGNAIYWSLGLLGGLLTLLGSGKVGMADDLKELVLATAPLMFTGLYMMLCKRHENSRKISRYVVRRLSERLRQLGVPYALVWDVDKLHPEGCGGHAADAGEDYSRREREKKRERWVASSCWLAGALAGIVVAICLLAWWRYWWALFALTAIPVFVAMARTKSLPDQKWPTFWNHLYRWLTTSLVPGLACTAAFYLVCGPGVCPMQVLGAVLLGSNALLSVRWMLDALCTDLALGRDMKDEQWRVEHRLGPRSPGG